MRVRVFAAEDRGLSKCFNFLRMSSGTGLQVFFCDPLKWLPPTAGEGVVADVHIYVDAPVRLAWPFARFNVVAVPEQEIMCALAWSWLKEPGVVDLFVQPDALQGDSKRVLATLRSLLATAQKKAHDAALPQQVAKGVTPPKVAIITATGGRTAWWSNMVQNVTGQAWPVSRLEWIIVDDEGDDNLADLVTEFRERAPGLVVRYKSVPASTTIGAKRNLACRLASADVSVFAVMDDDDHYPANSLSTRASWLLRPTPTDVVYCSTLPMYDIRKYVSAMNVPPLSDSPPSRVSEASLLFTRAAWEAQPFPESSMGEGAGLLEGRVGRTVEIGPADVIVSFIHGSNTSSRRVPATQEPNGCHYGFSDDYFRYLHERFGDAEKKTDS
jgi:hypothetical protein